MTAVWETRFDTQLPIEVDDPINTESYMKAANFVSDTAENNFFEHLLDGSPHLAKISDPKRILQLGCGNGKWAALMAAKYPQAEVTGVELSTLAGKEHPNLPNCRFVDHDAEATDSWGKDAYDFIYARYPYVRVKNWDAFLANVFTHLAPGGWVELVDSEPNIASDDGTLAPDSVTQKLFGAVCTILKASGKDIGSGVGPSTIGKMEKIGFTNVQTKVAKAPHSPWPKDPQYKKLGLLSLGLVSISVWAAQLQYGVGLPPDEARELAVQIMEECQGCTVHAYSTIRFIVAQKPQA